MVEHTAQPPGHSEGRHLVLFDGVCGLCSRIVQFVLAVDRRRVSLFAPLQSATGRGQSGERGATPTRSIRSM